MDIIIKRIEPKGETRSQIERKLEKEGWGRTISDEQRDKSAYLERLAKEKYGADKSHFRQHHIDEVK